MRGKHNPVLLGGYVICWECILSSCRCYLTVVRVRGLLSNNVMLARGSMGTSLAKSRVINILLCLPATACYLCFALVALGDVVRSPAEFARWPSFFIMSTAFFSLEIYSIGALWILLLLPWQRWYANTVFRALFAFGLCIGFLGAVGASSFMIIDFTNWWDNGYPIEPLVIRLTLIGPIAVSWREFFSKTLKTSPQG
jgi:hypothetical protein